MKKRLELICLKKEDPNDDMCDMYKWQLDYYEDDTLIDSFLECETHDTYRKFCWECGYKDYIKKDVNILAKEQDIELVFKDAYED